MSSAQVVPERLDLGVQPRHEVGDRHRPEVALLASGALSPEPAPPPEPDRCAPWPLHLEELERHATFMDWPAAEALIIRLLRDTHPDDLAPRAVLLHELSQVALEQGHWPRHLLGEQQSHEAVWAWRDTGDPLHCMPRDFRVLEANVPPRPTTYDMCRGALMAAGYGGVCEPYRAEHAVQRWLIDGLGLH